jgi:PAS domain S-box-containing protein
MTDYLPVQAAPAEIYLIDAATLRFVDVNEAARANLGYSLAQLRHMTPADLAPGLDPAGLATLLGGLGEEAGAQICVRTRHFRADGSSYPVTLHFWRTERDGRRLVQASGDDRSAEEQYQTRLHAIMSTLPGLVFQFLMRPDGSVLFLYLGEGCQQLLGLTVAQLQEQPELFLELVQPADRGAYLASMLDSAQHLSTWNWEGRIWVADWNDEKWINVRATPRALLAPRGAVQWEGIMTNITASKRAQQELGETHRRLAELAAHLEDAKEQERARIAREIHDDLGGNLTAIKMALSMLARRIGPDQQALAEKAHYVDQLVDRSIESVHRIALDLRPQMLDFGLVAALEWQCAEFAEQNGIACAFTSSDAELDLPIEQATALFRVVQEALTNIAKHAAATRVEVALQCGGGRLAVDVSDNGVGIAEEDRHKRGSFGLRGMAERVQALGGALSVANAHGGGTKVAISIPFTGPDTP